MTGAAAHATVPPDQKRHSKRSVQDSHRVGLAQVGPTAARRDQSTQGGAEDARRWAHARHALHDAGGGYRRGMAL